MNGLMNDIEACIKSMNDLEKHECAKNFSGK